VIPVHLFGQLAELGPILDIARRHGLFVLEDAAQAHGAARQGQRAGSFGDAGAFSFYPTKNLGALGDGGMVVTDDEGLAERIRLLRHYGQRAKNRHEIIGTNSRLDTLQAAVLRVKLRALDRRNEARRLAADRYEQRLSTASAGLAGISTRARAPRLPPLRRTSPRPGSLANDQIDRVGSALEEAVR